MTQKRRTIMAALLVIFLVIGVLLTAQAVINGFNPFFQAGPDIEPKNIIISNVTSSSATVSFSTGISTSAVFLKFGENAQSLTTFVYDIRGDTFQSTFHTFKLNNLRPENYYYYTFVVTGTEFTNKGAPYSLQTLPVASTPALPQVIAGSTSPGQANCLIFSHLIQGSATSYPISAISDLAGRFTLDTNTFYSKTTRDIISPAASDKILVYAYCPDGSKSAVVVDSGTGEVTLNSQTNKISVDYSNDLLAVAAAATPAPTATGTPAAAATPTVFSAPTKTPSPTSTPRPTAKTNDTNPTFTPTPKPVVPTKVKPTAAKLPATDINDTARIFLGLMFIVGGWMVRLYARKKRGEFSKISG